MVVWIWDGKGSSRVVGSLESVQRTLCAGRSGRQVRLARTVWATVHTKSRGVCAFLTEWINCAYPLECGGLWPACLFLCFLCYGRARMAQVAETTKEVARSLGLGPTRITTADPSDRLDVYERWIAEG
mmetsp:Transcript_6515/g.13090  ORF Transcript_6515/g.13090 Transcript_6515/m.13090 type:complete len:128 (-) Transcript_6515:1750-2133(-)